MHLVELRYFGLSDLLFEFLSQHCAHNLSSFSFFSFVSLSLSSMFFLRRTLFVFTCLSPFWPCIKIIFLLFRKYQKFRVWRKKSPSLTNFRNMLIGIELSLLVYGICETWRLTCISAYCFLDLSNLWTD